MLPAPPNKLLPPPLPVGVLAPKSGLVCCWLLFELLLEPLLEPAVPNRLPPAAPELDVLDPKLNAMLEVSSGAIRWVGNAMRSETIRDALLRRNTEGGSRCRRVAWIMSW